MIALALLASYAGIVPLAVLYWTRSAPTINWSGLAVWGGAAFLVAANAVIFKHPVGSPLLIQMVLLTAVATVLRVRKNAFDLGVRIALVTLAVVTMAVTATSALMFQSNDLMENRLLRLLAPSVLEGEAYRTYARRFLPLGLGPERQLQLQIRLDSGTPERDWRSANQLNNLEFETEPRPHTLFSPQGSNPFIFRGIDTGEALGGRNFRTQVELRSTHPDACGRLFLAERGARTFISKSVCPDKAWRNYELTWEAPRDIDNTAIDIVLNHYSVPIEIGQVRLEEQTANGWRSLPPLQPTGVGVHAGSRNTATSTLRIIPTPAWQDVNLQVPGSGRAPVEVKVEVERGIAVQVREISLRDASGRSAYPLPFFQRELLWFGHPNLLGHSVGTLAIWLVLFGRRRKSRTIALLSALIILFLSGSRTAWWLALTIYGVQAVLRLNTMRIPRGRGGGRRTLVWILVSSLILTVLGLVALGIRADHNKVARVFDVSSTTSRLDIWRVAIDAIAEHPEGLEPTSFAEVWRRERPTSTEMVSHAHNFWLHLTFHSGIVGAAAALWLTLGLLVSTLQYRSRKLHLWILAVLAMNLVDVTLLHSGVAVPLILGLTGIDEPPGNVGRAPHEELTAPVTAVREA